MPTLRQLLARSQNPWIKRAKQLVRDAGRLSLPLPRFVLKPMLWSYLAGREVVYFTRRTFIATPIFKAYVTKHGKGLQTDIFVHWITGKGDIILGDNVTFSGKSNISFAARFAERPTLEVGDNTGISGECRFGIGKRITIGRNCRLASEIVMSDSNGHPADPVARREGDAPADDEVRPITIGNDVWIGRRAMILPGVTIGDGAIISSGAVVMSDVAPYTVVAGNPARKIAQVPRTNVSAA